jgi:hypothetical protein
MPIGFMDKVINCFIVKGSIERARLRLHDFKSCMARFDATPLRFVGSMTAGLRLLGLESCMAHFDATPLCCVGSMTARHRLLDLKSCITHFDSTPLRCVGSMTVRRTPPAKKRIRRENAYQ